jgi:4-hydroxy-3-methylbut-2-enyl diphosphate reductase
MTRVAHTDLLVLAPLALEARAIRAGAPALRVRRLGMGPRRARRFALHAGPASVLVAGFCGALDAALEPGDVVLADRLIGPRGTVPCADPSPLADALRAAGLRVHVAAIASSTRLVTGARRASLRRTGALAVDMESVWVAADRPPLVLRVVLDGPGRELHRPLATLRGARRAYRSLRRAAAVVGELAIIESEPR